MPNCFQLTRKGESEPSKLNEVDQALCDHFKVPCHPIDWYRNWYSTIGFGLATGQDWEELKAYYPELVDVIMFLAEHYDVSAFYQHK